jgi:hypothetical protein
LLLKDEVGELEPAWRATPFESDGRIGSHQSLEEKCTWLLALHEIVCPGQAQHGPTPYPDWWKTRQSRRLAARWGFVVCTVKEIGFRKAHRDDVNAWLKDVESALISARAIPANGSESGPEKPRLTEYQKDVLRLIRSVPPDEGITGRAIVEAMFNSGKQITQGSLTKHIIPILKQHYGVKNKPRVGYFCKKP